MIILSHHGLKENIMKPTLLIYTNALMLITSLIMKEV